jgi:uncharacterized membrane protein (DUF4010 family)
MPSTETALLPEILSQLWARFLLVTLFGFLTGLEMRAYLLERGGEQADHTHFRAGSARTYTLIAALGFVLHTLDPAWRLYLAGMGVLTVFYGLFYHHKLQSGQMGILQPLIALIVYTYGPSVALLPPWFLVLSFVATVFILNARPLTHRLLETIDRGELLTLAKFLLLAAVILPLMPDHRVAAWLPATPYKIWVAVVAISGISYLGYILQRYLFPRQGYLVTGLLGGLYSSTATTIVLARRGRAEPQALPQIQAAIVAASGMMYLRLLALILLLNREFLRPTAAPLLLLGIAAIAYGVLRFRHSHAPQETRAEAAGRNPLELGTAALFALLFVVMLVLTKGVLHHFGSLGLQILSFVVGFTDIDPFVLSLLNGQYHATGVRALAGAMIIAAGSNNFLKAVYAVTLGGWPRQRRAFLALILLGILTMGYGLFLSF